MILIHTHNDHIMFFFQNYTSNIEYYKYAPLFKIKMFKNSLDIFNLNKHIKIL
jgi:hypothetical protein